MLLSRNKLTKIGNQLIFLTIKRNIMDLNILLNCVKASIMPLSDDKHKGQAGRIGIIGGSLEYTGAPYFAGISALKVGADLAHIFCTSSAAPVIKSFSPELIVHPLLDHTCGVEEIVPWLDRIHVLVIGPGMGRDPNTFKVVSDIIKISRSKLIPLVIDADGLFLITEKLDLIKDYPAPGVILTPNKIEYERLYAKIKCDKGGIDFNKLGDNITILKKGAIDEVYSSDKELEWKSNGGGSNRRCGGQGDLLSGSIATLLHWCLSKEGNNPNLAATLACYGGSCLVRLCNEKSFKEKGRSMLASDMIEKIHSSFEELYES